MINNHFWACSQRLISQADMKLTGQSPRQTAKSGKLHAMHHVEWSPFPITILLLIFTVMRSINCLFMQIIEWIETLIQTKL
jgi:hypothetical protein